MMKYSRGPKVHRSSLTHYQQLILLSSIVFHLKYLRKSTNNSYAYILNQKSEIIGFLFAMYRAIYLLFAFRFVLCYNLDKAWYALTYFCMYQYHSTPAFAGFRSQFDFCRIYFIGFASHISALDILHITQRKYARLATFNVRVETCCF